MIDDWKVMLEQNENLRQRIRDLEAVEQAMGEDLVRLAERCDHLEGEVSVERHNLAISEHQRRELEAEIARLQAALDEKKSLAADSRAPGC